jgi:putative copper resistance protein D
VLRRPWVAVPIYVLVLYSWHFGFMFEGAVRHGAVHALQHASFIGIGVLVWWSAIDPKRRHVQGELWKVPYMLGARFSGMFLGMAFVFIRVPVYTGVYGSGERLGMTPLHDQQLAGGMMVTLDIMVMVFVLCFFFLRAAQDAEEEPRAVGPGVTSR